MKRDTAIKRLKKCKRAIKQLGATSLYLFGSTARNQAKPTSDIDIMIDYDASRFSLIELMTIQDFIRKRLGLPVDVIPRDCLKPSVRIATEKEAIKVF